MFHKQIGTGYYALVSSGSPSSADKDFVRAACDKAFSTPIELSEPIQVSSGSVVKVKFDSSNDELNGGLKIKSPA